MDATDKGAVRLVRRIAEKALEPLNDEAPAEKTIGEWRRELAALHIECVNYIRARHAALGKEPD